MENQKKRSFEGKRKTEAKKENSCDTLDSTNLYVL